MNADLGPSRAFRTTHLLLLFAIAAAGLLAGELLGRESLVRGFLARALGRGELVAVVRGAGIYAPASDSAEVESLVEEAKLRFAAQGQPVSPAQIQHEIDLFRAQFASASAFAQALAKAGTSEPAFRTDVAEHLRSRAWIEQRIAPELVVTEAESRRFYEEHKAAFTLPPRLRASHIFLAAPDGSPPELMEAKQRAVADLARRIAQGEALATLAAEASEDEATKGNGGDLGFFSAHRMPPEFVAEMEKLQVSQISAPLRSHLGFHIAQLTDARPARLLSFEEVREEIERHLLNQKRAQAVAALAEHLGPAEFIRPKS